MLPILSRSGGGVRTSGSPYRTTAADTSALTSGSASNDRSYTRISSSLRTLTADRDALAARMRTALNRAAFGGASITAQQAKAFAKRAAAILARADRLAGR